MGGDNADVPSSTPYTCPGRAVAHHGGFDRHLSAQLFDAIARCVLLCKAEYYACDHDRRVRPVSGKGGHHGGEDKDEHQGTAELSNEGAQRGVMPAWFQQVGSHLL